MIPELVAAAATGAVAGVAAMILATRHRRGRPPPTPPPSPPLGPPLGALAAGIVHEIAQPLSAARVSVEGLHYLRQLGRDPTPEQIARTLDRVGMSLLTMNQILDHLRFLAGGQARQLAPTPLHEAIQALVADRDNWLRWSDVRLETPEPTVMATALADHAGLRLILANLVRNAAEAVAALPPDRRWVSLGIASPATIKIADPGPGIPPELLGRLFEPSVTTRGEARGVGLSLARAAAERMGGQLACLPRPGGGTIFQLSLVPAASGGTARIVRQ